MTLEKEKLKGRINENNIQTMDILNRNEGLPEFYEHLKATVGKLCEGRDDSHGLAHAIKVTENAVTIWKMTPVSSMSIEKLLACAMIHDVMDHKYDPENRLEPELRYFLKQHFVTKDIEEIISIINAVSFSKEKKRGKRYFETYLTEDAIKCRDIVSDADKLEALGKIGFDRCVEYSQHAYKKKHGVDITKELLKKEVEDHAEEKLYVLANEYIVTPGGKKMAAKLTDELKTLIDAM